METLHRHSSISGSFYASVMQQQRQLQEPKPGSELVLSPFKIKDSSARILGGVSEIKIIPRACVSLNFSNSTLYNGGATEQFVCV